MLRRAFPARTFCTSSGCSTCVLSMGLQPGCSSGGRSLRQPEELETFEIWVSSPGSSRFRRGCLHLGLDPVGEDLSFLSVDTDFESFEPAALIWGTSELVGSSLASPDMVLTASVSGQVLLPFPNPCLTQRVGSETCSLGSSRILHLHVRIFRFLMLRDLCGVGWGLARDA